MVYKRSSFRAMRFLGWKFSETLVVTHRTTLQLTPHMRVLCLKPFRLNLVLPPKKKLIAYGFSTLENNCHYLVQNSFRSKRDVSGCGFFTTTGSHAVSEVFGHAPLVQASSSLSRPGSVVGSYHISTGNSLSH